MLFADDSEHEMLRRKAKILSTMYDWLEYLAGQSYTFGALSIAEAVLFSWKEHFESNPLYEQLTTLLFQWQKTAGLVPNGEAQASTYRGPLHTSYQQP